MNKFPMDADILSPSDDSEKKIFCHEPHKLVPSVRTRTRQIFYKEESFLINSCIYEVNRKLGTGFLEAVYQEALEIELKQKNIPFERQKGLKIFYDETPLSCKYIADIICYDKIIIEIKAVSNINNQHKAQLLNYLAITGLKLGLLVNFSSFPKAEVIRMVR